MTKAILLPINIVAINHAGLSVKKDKIRALISPLLLSNSILSLLEEIKAISIPEKKAEHAKESSTNKSNVSTVIYFLGSFVELALFNRIRRPLLTRKIPQVKGTRRI